VATSPDYSPVCSPDTSGRPADSLDSLGPIPIGLGAATDLFCAAKAAEGASPRTVEWYQMILVRAVSQFGAARPVDAIPAAHLRAWLLELCSTLAPESIAGYVRGLKAFGNWCAAEELAAAIGFRGLRRPKVPHRLIAPFSDPELRSLLALADERERALTLVLLDTGLRHGFLDQYPEQFAGQVNAFLKAGIPECSTTRHPTAARSMPASPDRRTPPGRSPAPDRRSAGPLRTNVDWSRPSFRTASRSRGPAVFHPAGAPLRRMGRRAR
jgi:hypothetical protein